MNPPQVTMKLLSFPDPVNEVSARLVAGGVVVLALATIALDLPWLTALIAYGFVARVLTGPKLSPLGQMVTRVVTPRLPVAPRLVPGPPKRFAQGIGASLSMTAAVLHFGFAATGPALILVGMIAAAATLESAFGLCLGCLLFARLVALGVIPSRACVACADLPLQRPTTAG